MRGAWLDADDPVGRNTRRHDGAPHRHDHRDRPDGETTDDGWVPPSLRGGRVRPPANPRRTSVVPGRRLRGAWLSDDSSPAGRAHRHTEPRSGSAKTSDVEPPSKQPAERPEVPVAAPGWTSAVAVLGGIFVLGMLVAGATGNSETRTAAVVMVVLGLIFMPVLRRLAGGRRDYQQILTAGLLFKVVMTIARYYLASGGYYNQSDATGYDSYGRSVANDYLKHGHLPPWSSFTGTSFLRLVTGFVYTIMPASELAAFFVFSAFGFIGSLLFWRALQKFAPPPHDRTYLMLLMFVPSFVYWPSALGKEAFIILCLGLATYGFACILKNQILAGVLCIAGGVYGATMVRPHIGVALMLGLTVATFLAKQSGRRAGLIAMGLILVVGSGFVISRANAFFKQDITSASAVTNQLNAAGQRTGEGGSQFAPSPVSPQNFPFALMTVLVRPFPWEASSAPELATAIESLLIAYLIIKGMKTVRGRIRRDNPLAIYALTVTLVFVVLFWQFSNFGILARQRTQIAPFMFMLLAMPITEHVAKKNERQLRRSGQRAWANWDAVAGEGA